MLSSEGFRDFSLVNKNADDKVLKWVDTCLDEVPGSTVCAHYSIRYNKDKGGAEATFRRFSEHLHTLEKRGHGTRAEVLLISGSGPKTPLDTVACLERLKDECLKGAKSNEQGRTAANPQLGVAFNPYYADDAQAQIERQRLRSKLATNQIQSVWLQFGSGTDLLTQSLQWLRDVEPTIRIVGSLFLPTKQLIAQQRFRPWNGVFLSPEYLSGPECAETISKEILAIYLKFGVEVLVEAPGVRTLKDIATLRSLLAPPTTADPGTPSAHDALTTARLSSASAASSIGDQLPGKFLQCVCVCVCVLVFVLSCESMYA